MVTDTFFDLQRFDEGDGVMTTTAALGATNAEAKDTLVGSSVNGGTFTWQNGSTFVNDGTAENPVYHLDTTGAEGTAAVTGSAQIALHGTRDGYSFAINETKNNWEVALKGSDNTITGDFSQEEGLYLLSGEATVKVYAGKSFDENVNNDQAYVKAANAADVPVTVSSDGSSAISYTLDNDKAAAVVVDNDDTAVFKGAYNTPAEMTLGAAASPNAEAASIPGVQFSGDASVVATSDNDVIISVKDSVRVGIAGDVWAFTNKSTRDNAVLVVDDSTGEVAAVAATKGVTVRADDDGIEKPVNVNGTQWDAIIASTLGAVPLEVDFDESGNATINNTVYNATAQEFVPRGTDADADKNGGVTVKGAAGATAEFATLTAAGVIANGATIRSAAANGADDIKVTLEADGIEAIKMGVTKPRTSDNTVINPTDYANDPDGPITISGDANKSFDVQAEEDVFSVSTTADIIAVDVHRIISTGTGTDNNPSYQRQRPPHHRRPQSILQRHGRRGRL